MERVQRLDYYLEMVPLPLLLLAALAAGLVFIMVPSRHRLSLSLVLVVPWLVVARMPGLGPIQAVAKMSSALPFLLVALSALLHPGPRRRLPAVVGLYPIMAVVALVCVLTVDERVVAVIVRIQWLALTLAAIALARTIVSGDDLLRFARSLGIGGVLAIALPLSALVLFPGESFLKGRNRFQPYGVNSNQIGVLFMLVVPLATYFALTTRQVYAKPVLLFAAAVSLGMALITGSRQTLLVIGIVLLPVILRYSRRPIIMLVVLGFGVGGMSWLLGMAETDALERFGSLESGRFQIWAEYMAVFADRPFFGLAGTRGQSVFEDSSVGMHPHNAYLELMYVGGLTLMVPMLYLVARSIASAWCVWRWRRWLGSDPLLLSMLAAMLGAMYLQGLGNQIIYWPTYAWSFLHIVLSCLFIGVAHDLRTVGEAVLPAAADLGGWEPEPDDFDHDVAGLPDPA